MMQLNEIVGEKSIKAISQKTMISEQNIALLIAEDFSSLPKAKAIGFISILERDYKVDLGALRKTALEYYKIHGNAEENINIAFTKAEAPKGRSKLFPLFILGVLAYASWYFFTQFDKKMLTNMMPFSQEEKKESLSTTETQEKTDTTQLTSKTEKPIHSKSPHTLAHNKKIVLLPAEKLWFGLIDTETGERDQKTIDKQYNIDVTKKNWLLATSAANFALINKNDTKEYNDGRKHYFKVNNEGVEPLTKAEYIEQGGYKRW